MFQNTEQGKKYNLNYVNEIQLEGINNLLIIYFYNNIDLTLF